MSEMDVVLPPGSHPYPEADLFEIPPEGGSTGVFCKGTKEEEKCVEPPEGSSTIYLCKGTREGEKCGLPKMYPRSKCENPKCSKYGETRKRDSYTSARKSSGNAPPWTSMISSMKYPI